MAITMERLAARIRQGMQSSGMTQRALGAAIGLDPPTLSKALNGKRGFKPLELALISDALNIPVQQLLADESPSGNR